MFILKQLRRKKNLNQTEFARIIGVSLRTIQLYEKKDANIPIKNLTKIAKYFDVTIAELYAQEGVNEQGSEYEKLDLKLKNGHTISKLGPGKYLVSAPLVTALNYKNYIDNPDDRPLIKTLPKVGFVIDQVSVGKYMAFEISNDSMDDGTVDGVPNKSIVLSKLMPPKKVPTIVRNYPKSLWILDYGNRVMCKKITDFDKKKNILKCGSLNNSPEYADFEVKISDVRQFYHIIKRQV